MTTMMAEDPAAPDEVEECEAVIACLGDDAALLRHDNPDCEIAANMDAAADMLEKLRATEVGAREAFGAVVQDKRDLEAECKRLRELLDSAHAMIRQKPSLPPNATEPMQKAMQRAVLLRKSMNDVWHAALSELGA